MTAPNWFESMQEQKEQTLSLVTIGADGDGSRCFNRLVEVSAGGEYWVLEHLCLPLELPAEMSFFFCSLDGDFLSLEGDFWGN